MIRVPAVDDQRAGMSASVNSFHDHGAADDHRAVLDDQTGVRDQSVAGSITLLSMISTTTMITSLPLMIRKLFVISTHLRDSAEHWFFRVS